jgi:nucleoid-associated protein YgaU
VASFEELKSKYQSVLKVAQDKKVQMANLHLQDGKLYMKGTAPSLDAANAVWNELKRINPKLDDVTADFPVEPTQAQAAQSNVKTYTVKAGDTLSKISKDFYGNANDYMKIFNANRDKLQDPDKIQPGQELKIPAA